MVCAAALTLATLTACDSASPGSAGSVPATTAPTSAAPTPAGTGDPSAGVTVVPPSGESPSGPTAPPPADKPIAATTVVSGKQGSLSWRITLPQFTGTAAAAEISRRVRASAQDAIDRAKQEAKDDDGTKRKITGEGTVTTNDNRTAFPVLAAAVRKRAENEGNPVTESDGIAPRESNRAAWQTDVYGLRFYFQDFQLGGHGLRSYTIPWPSISRGLLRGSRALTS